MKLCTCLLFAPIAAAQFYGQPQGQILSTSPIVPKIGITQEMGAQVPLGVPFVDEAGRERTLGDYTGKPVILALVYYQCPSLCNLVLNGLLRAAKEIPMEAGKDYEIVAMSFDPRETEALAREKKKTYAAQYGRSGAGWHFLTGPEMSSKKVADAVGFHYYYDSLTNQYGHSSAIIILTPTGKVARYFYGVDYPARDLRLALGEASNGQVSTPTDQLLLYCFHYDPATGKYALVIMNLLRIGGIVTLAGLLAFMLVMLRRDHRAAQGREA